MQKNSFALKAILLLLINTIPLAFSVFCYEGGILSTLFVFPPAVALFGYINYCMCDKTLSFALMQLYFFIVIVFSGYISTSLYYHNIGHTSETLLVGTLSTFLKGAVVAIGSVIASIAKAKENKP